MVVDINVHDLTFGSDPKVQLLGIFYVAFGRYDKLLIFYATFYACREILLNWKPPNAPKLTSWRAVINKVSPIYKISYNQ